LDEQFIQLEELQDDANPNFVEEVVTSYYQNTSTLVIVIIEQALLVSFPPPILFYLGFLFLLLFACLFCKGDNDDNNVLFLAGRGAHLISISSIAICISLREVAQGKYV
jgi:hypothetical protein